MRGGRRRVGGGSSIIQAFCKLLNMCSLTSRARPLCLQLLLGRGGFVAGEGGGFLTRVLPT